MSEIEELIKQIEELRASLIKIQKGKNFTDPEVVTASQMLDAVLDKYQGLMMRMKKIDDSI